MAKLHQVLVATLIFQACAFAAPSDISKLEEIANVEEDITLDREPQTLIEETKDENNTSQQGQRQKRFYNYYGFPPVNPINYPSYYPRDTTQDNGGYGYDDPLTHIYRRLQDISTVIRQPNIPPLPPVPGPFPIYVPVIYIPPAGCACTPNQNVPTNNQNVPSKNGTSPDILTRFPEMEDERQNWGFVINQTEEDDGQEEDYTRPISFDPIIPDRPMSRPPPAVEHGSNQGGLNPVQSTTTIRPSGNVPNTSSRPSARPDPPSTCDGAVLSCCHQPEVTYNCFAVQGCPDPTAFGNPCDPQVILRVIEKFQQFYSQRSG